MSSLLSCLNSLPQFTPHTSQYARHPKAYGLEHHKMPIPTEPTLSLIDVIIGIITVVVSILALMVEFGSYIEARKRGKS
jgi:hypothetical protein